MEILIPIGRCDAADQAQRASAYRTASYAVLATHLGYGSGRITLVQEAPREATLQWWQWPAQYDGFTLVRDDWHPARYLDEEHLVLLAAGQAADRVFGAGTAEPAEWSRMALNRDLAVDAQHRSPRTQEALGRLREAAQEYSRCEAEALVRNQRALITAVAERLLEEGALSGRR